MGIFGFKGSNKKKDDQTGFVPTQSSEAQTPKNNRQKPVKKTPGIIGKVSPTSPVTTPVKPQTTTGYVAQPTDGSSFPKAEDAKAGTTGTVIPASDVHPLYDPNTQVPAPSYTGGSFFTKKTPFVYKKLVEKKLAIILVEDTTLVGTEKDKITKIIKSVVSEGNKACIITYGEKVQQSEIFEVIANGGVPFPVNENVGETACLFDALIAIEKLVSDKMGKIEETDTQRVMISDVDVIGIGTCTDNGSKASKDEAFEAFYKVTSRHHVMTKYFCLTEASFMNAAEAGFRSIGAIFRNYQ